MAQRHVTYVAQDDQRRTWALPKHSSPHLLMRAVDAWAKGGDEALATFGLTKSETELVAEVVAWLEEHGKVAA